MPESYSGTDYRYLYVVLYNMGKGHRLVDTDDEKRSLKQILVDMDYEIIYEPTGERDIIVGKKDAELIGVADLWGPWARDLTERPLNTQIRPSERWLIMIDQELNRDISADLLANINDQLVDHLIKLHEKLEQNITE